MLFRPRKWHFFVDGWRKNGSFMKSDGPNVGRYKRAPVVVSGMVTLVGFPRYLRDREISK